MNLLPASVCFSDYRSVVALVSLSFFQLLAAVAVLGLGALFLLFDLSRETLRELVV